MPQILDDGSGQVHVTGSLLSLVLPLDVINPTGDCYIGASERLPSDALLLCSELHTVASFIQLDDRNTIVKRARSSRHPPRHATPRAGGRNRKKPRDRCHLGSKLPTTAHGKTFAVWSTEIDCGETRL